MQSIERLSALHRNLLRKFASEEGLQLVHVEILQYLATANRYSNTSQALTEFLGQTKGTISQSLAHLEERGYVRKSRDKNDGRVFHLQLQAKGLAVTRRLHEAVRLEGGTETETILAALLASLQKKFGMRSFGLCKTCKFNQSPDKNTFVCGLTQEPLTREDIERNCREHEAK